MRPFTLLIKPAGPDCNIRCEYCFYCGKTSLFGLGRHRMSDETLEKLISDYLGLRMQSSSFAWQGGEPTLMGLDFFRRAVELQKHYGADGQVLSNALQTNAILLDSDEWGEFLHEYRFLVGVSMDGPERLHDIYRRDAAGRGTWSRVIKGIDILRKHRVEFNILVLLNDRNVQEPDELFDFFTGMDVHFLQFVPCVERDPETGQKAGFAVTAEQYGAFMCRIFDRWMGYGPQNISIRMFDSLMHFMATGRHTNCTFGKKCDDYIVVEHDGGVYCCDFFVEPQWYCGNIMASHLKDLFNSPVKHNFARLKRQLHNKCSVCRYHDVCRGGCPKDRMVIVDDVKQPSFLCEAYKGIFDHAMPTLRDIIHTHIASQRETESGRKTNEFD